MDRKFEKVITWKVVLFFVISYETKKKLSLFDGLSTAYKK